MINLIFPNASSTGLHKNSPIKPRMDKYIGRVLEAGLIKKWLHDVIDPTLNAEVFVYSDPTKALMNMDKFIGAVVALVIGYIFSTLMFLLEILYFTHFIAKHPYFDKHLKKIDKRQV